MRAVRQAFYSGNPIRVLFQPVGSITNYFHNPELNTRHIPFDRFFTDPSVQITAQLEYRHWVRHHLLCDNEMGLPDQWQLSLDFQNSYDASWAGCPLKYNGLYLPDTLPIFREHKEALYDMPKLLPVENGVIGTGMEFLDFMENYCRNHTYMDRPICPPRNFVGEGTDGILNLAYKLRGPEKLLVDMLEDEEYYSDLMEWNTSNLIHRIRSLREMHAKRWGDTPHGFCYADDAMCLISHETYKEYVLPYQRRLIFAFNEGRKIGMHICGRNMQHFGGLVQELPIDSFDTGFPIDFDRLRDLVGDDVTISGGPTVMLVKDGTQEQVRQETRRILNTRSARRGRFIMIAANNTAPCTPVENIAAMYDTVKQYDFYAK